MTPECCPACRLRHKHFFRAAQRRGAVDAALRFLSLLPRGATDARTYTMAVSVCAAAQDVHAALQVADMWRSTGRKPDTFLYTNVIRSARCAACMLLPKHPRSLTGPLPDVIPAL